MSRPADRFAAVRRGARRRPSSRRFVAAVLVLAAVLAAAVSPFASSSPDGLERVAADKAFVDRGRAHDAPLPGYAVPGVAGERAAAGLAGLAGVVGVFALASGVGVLVRRRTTA